MNNIKFTFRNSIQQHLSTILTMMLFILCNTILPAQQTHNYTTPDSYTFTVPKGVYSIIAEVWGAGGGGGGSSSNNSGGSGGGGGGYSSGNIDVTPGQSITLVVGAGGVGGAAGNNPGADGGFSRLTAGAVTLQANGGKGGQGNKGTHGSGGTATGGTINTTGANGTTGGISGGNGGNGANGGNGGTGSTNANGGNGNAPGGGGGGGEKNGSTNRAGGAGGAGRVIISWIAQPTGVATNTSCPNIADGKIDINTPVEFIFNDKEYIDLNTPFLSNLSQFTIEGWIKFNISDVTGTRGGGLFGQNDAIEFGILSSSTIHLWTGNGGSLDINPNTSNLGNNTWRHIAAVGNGTRLRVYIDGVQVAEGGNTTTNYGASAFSAKIGGGVYDPTEGTFPGQIRRVGFWNRALSAAEIANMASFDRFYTATETGLIAGYNFLEGTGTTLSSLPAGRNGTFYNTPTWILNSSYSWTKTGDPTFLSSSRNIAGLTSGEYVLTTTTGNATSQNSFMIGTDYNCPTYWVGSTDTDWAKDINWSGGYVPPTGNDVEFATTANNSGTAAIRDLVLDQDREIGNLTNLSSRNLIIPTNRCLTVNGSIVTDNNPNRIQIKASTDGTQPNGSLIFRNENNPVFGTVEMYSKAYKDGSAVNNMYKWQYFTIPVREITASPTHDGSWVRRWEETGTTVANHWIQLDNWANMTSFTGYEITHDNPKTIFYQGILEKRDFSRSLAYTASALYPGQHIFGNPYAAAIDITQLNFGSDTEASVYLYNTGSYDDWENNSGETSTGTSPGQYTVAPKNSAGTGGIPGQIPSMQGFLVKAKSNSANATFGIPYSAVVNKNTTLQRAKENAELTSDKAYLRIEVKGEKAIDKMWLITREGTSKGFDNGWDGYKMMGVGNVPQLFAAEKSGYLQVSTSENINNTHIGFQPGTDVQYTLSFAHENLSSYYTMVELVDLAENRTIDIMQPGASYQFYAPNKELNTKRFMIRTEKAALKSFVKIYAANNTIFIENNSVRNGQMYIYNLTGKLIDTYLVEADNINTIPVILPNGAYIVKVLFDDDVYSEKIMLLN